MRYIALRIRDRQRRKIWFDYYLQIWFRYHTVFFGSLIFNGYKLRAFNNFIFIKQNLKLSERNDPYLVFLIAMMRVTPDITFTPKRLGGSSHGVPIPITEKKRVMFGVKWIVKMVRDNNSKDLISSIANLLILSSQGKGPAVAKKQSVHLIGIKNRHFLKFFK